MRQTIFLSLSLLFLYSCNQQKATAITVPIKKEATKNATAQEALLIGTFHYNNPGADVAKTKSFDILSEKSQKELAEITLKIKDYKPTKIFVEWPYEEQQELDSLYQLYLQDKYFTNDKLSNFYLKNEIFQLAFRVAKVSKLERVYAVDYGETEFPYGAVMDAIAENKQSALKEEIESSIAKVTKEFDDKINAGISLKALTYYENTPEMRAFSNYLHNNLMLQAGKVDNFSGPFLTSEWYKRNLYMWSMVQKHTAKTDERVMLLMGASHIAMIEQFISDDKDWKVKEFKEMMNEK